MRALLLVAISSLGLIACSEQKPADPAPTPAAEVAAPEAALAPEVVNIPPAEVATRLQGKWQSTEDAASIITITADTWANTYTGDDSVNDVAK